MTINFDCLATYTQVSMHYWHSKAQTGGITDCSVVHLDYDNATLVGIPQHLLQGLQSVMNSAARLIYPSSRFSHITPLLQRLHWLKAKERIDFKVAVLKYKCINTGLCHRISLMSSVVRRMCKVAAIFVLRRYHNWSSAGPAVPLLVIGPSWLPALVSGITYRSTSHLLLPCKFLKVVLRLTCLRPLLFNSFI